MTKKVLLVKNIQADLNGKKSRKFKKKKKVKKVLKPYIKIDKKNYMNFIKIKLIYINIY